MSSSTPTFISSSMARSVPVLKTLWRGTVTVTPCRSTTVCLRPSRTTTPASARNRSEETNRREVSGQPRHCISPSPPLSTAFPRIAVIMTTAVLSCSAPGPGSLRLISSRRPAATVRAAPTTPSCALYERSSTCPRRTSPGRPCRRSSRNRRALRTRYC